MDIEVKRIEFAYSQDRNVINSLSCRFLSGNFYAIIGPNGSGKSTFIKLLNGLLQPTAGEILLDTKALKQYHRRELARHVGYVPQSGGYNGLSTVYDTILLGRRPHVNWAPGRNDREKTAQIIEEFSLDHLALRYTNELSGGELQRVNIARALVQEPEILILDEPTSSLDLKHQIEVMKLLKTISKRDITVIIAIHDLNLAMRYAGCFLLLKEGNLISFGGEKVVSEENLSRLYDVKINIIENNGRKYVLPQI